MKKTSKDNKSVIIQNHCDMDNHKRITNIVLGYQIQANRLMNYVQEAASKKEENINIKKVIDTSLETMKKIQRILQEIAQKSDKYYKHISSNIYCRRMMKTYAKQLSNIISEVNILLERTE